MLRGTHGIAGPVGRANRAYQGLICDRAGQERDELGLDRKFVKDYISARSIMKRILQNSFLLGLFVAGVIMYPAWHRSHCSDAGAGCPSHQEEGKTGECGSPSDPLSGHDSAKCPVCQLANTPVMTATVEITSVGKVLDTEEVLFQIVIPVSASLRDASQARAPPSC